MAEIVIIDDDPDSRNLLRAFLQDHFFRTRVYRNAEEFLHDFDKAGDLYLIDINLGGMSGDEVCKRLKGEEQLKTKPVVIISAHPEIEKLSNSACADAFLAKPLSRRTLQALIGSLLS